MKVLISWSGDRSRIVAEKLHNWLPDVIQSIDPWMSREDLRSGSRWLTELAGQLAGTHVAILVLTPENVTAPWICFEAGAVSKVIDKSLVIPYLVGFDPGDIPSGPLTQFQAQVADKEGTLNVIDAINMPSGAVLDAQRLRKSFELHWHELESCLQSLPDPKPGVVKTPLDEFMGEILAGIRLLLRSQAGVLRSSISAADRYPINFELDKGLAAIASLRAVEAACEEIEFRGHASEGEVRDLMSKLDRAWVDANESKLGAQGKIDEYANLYADVRTRLQFIIRSLRSKGAR